MTEEVSKVVLAYLDKYAPDVKDKLVDIYIECSPEGGHDDDMMHEVMLRRALGLNEPKLF